MMMMMNKMKKMRRNPSGQKSPKGTKPLPRLRLSQKPMQRNEFDHGPFRFYGVMWESKPFELVSLLLFCSMYAVVFLRHYGLYGAPATRGESSGGKGAGLQSFPKLLHAKIISSFYFHPLNYPSGLFIFGRGPAMLCCNASAARSSWAFRASCGILYCRWGGVLKVKGKKKSSRLMRKEEL